MDVNLLVKTETRQFKRDFSKIVWLVLGCLFRRFQSLSYSIVTLTRNCMQTTKTRLFLAVLGYS